MPLSILVVPSRYGGPGFHSGYNEVIVNSRSVNAALPRSILAFFVPIGAPQGSSTWGTLWTTGAHRVFLMEHGLTVEQVPLVQFDASNWDAPFSNS